MSQPERRAIEAAIAMCLDLRTLMQPYGPRHILLLLDMLLFELGRQLASSSGPANGADDPGT